MKPRLLDLFCGAGGAAQGYAAAGFDVVGIDIEPQPNYPFEFYRCDALAFLERTWRVFAAVHASPVCKDYSPLSARHPHIKHPRQIPELRAALVSTGRPFIIENVMSAPLDKVTSIRLCGGMFGLRTYRHRRFEPGGGLKLTEPPHPKHVTPTATKQRRARWDEGWHVSITGDVGTYCGPEAMGIDWMTGNELCEAIPPAYTAFVGRQVISQIGRLEVAS